jgi:hypothetical protein
MGADEQTETDLDLPGVPVNQFKLRIAPKGGGLGTQAPRIRFALRLKELTFLARGDAPYRLGVGRADAEAADLPLSTLIPPGIEQAIASGQLGRAVIEPMMPQAAPLAAPGTGETGDGGAESGGLGEKKVVLWSILFVGVLLLAGMVFSLLLKNDRPGKR